MQIIRCFAYFHYACAWGQLIPMLGRIIKRKSSEDYSLVAQFIDLAGLLFWFTYVMCVDRSIELVICCSVDMFMWTIMTIIIIKYHGRKKGNKFIARFILFLIKNYYPDGIDVVTDHHDNVVGYKWSWTKKFEDEVNGRK